MINCMLLRQILIWYDLSIVYFKTYFLEIRIISAHGSSLIVIKLQYNDKNKTKIMILTQIYVMFCQKS